MNKARKALCEAYISTLKEGYIPWESSLASDDICLNAINGLEYQGVNRLILLAFKTANGFTSNLWVTKSQAKKAKLKLIDGSPCAYLEYYVMGEVKNPDKVLSIADFAKKVLENPEVSKNYIKVPKVFLIYNIESFENTDSITKKATKKDSRVFVPDFVDNLPKKLGVEVYHDLDKLKQNRQSLKHMKLPDATAFYVNEQNAVYTPEKESYKTEYDFFATLLHELCHSTGDAHRLARPYLKEEGSEYGSIGYAKEELRAEIASSFLTQDLAIHCNPKNLTNHKAYIKSWINILEDDYLELSNAIDEAFTIEDYILKIGEYAKYYKDAK